MFGKLFVVATPIGNLQDVTLRGIDTIYDIDIVLAEDTRVTSKLLQGLNSKVETRNSKLVFSDDWKMKSGKLTSYHQHSPDAKKFEILKYLLDGKNIALVTDAGTPGISDPGNELIDFILSKEPDIQIVPIPGPSALTAALSVCGFRVDRYIFAGFLPKKHLGKIFTQVKTSGYALVFFESPKRILKTLDRLIEEFGGEKRVFVARELTKLHEETYRGNLVDVKNKMEKSDPRGEVTVVLEGKDGSKLVD